MGKEKEGVIELEGTVQETLPGAQFIVKVDDDNYPEIRATLAGRMRNVHFIKILPGDRVTIEISPYDLTKGRITYRLKHES